MLHQLDLLVPDGSSISRVVLVKSNPLGPSGLSSVKFDLLLARSNMNDLVDGVSLRFYWGI
jgi:hypothetical protein